MLIISHYFGSWSSTSNTSPNDNHCMCTILVPIMEFHMHSCNEKLGKITTNLRYDIFERYATRHLLLFVGPLWILNLWGGWRTIEKKMKSSERVFEGECAWSMRNRKREGEWERVCVRERKRMATWNDRPGSVVSHRLFKIKSWARCSFCIHVYNNKFKHIY